MKILKKKQLLFWLKLFENTILETISLNVLAMTLQKRVWSQISAMINQVKINILDTIKTNIERAGWTIEIVDNNLTQPTKLSKV